MFHLIQSFLIFHRNQQDQYFTSIKAIQGLYRNRSTTPLGIKHYSVQTLHYHMMFVNTSYSSIYYPETISTYPFSKLQMLMLSRRHTMTRST